MRKTKEISEFNHNKHSGTEAEYNLLEVNMKKGFAVIACVVLMVFVFSPSTHGAGFLIYEHGAAAMAMGGAFVGLANDVTTIFHNPAGIAWLDGTQISAGATLIFPISSLNMPNIGFVNPAYAETYEQEKQVFYPPTFYISHKFSDRIVAGFGFFAPYGLGTEWPDSGSFPLRYIATKSDMQTLIFNPTVAFKLNDNLSVAVGVSYIHSKLLLDLTYLLDLTGIGMSIYDVPVSVEEASGTAWGLNAGALYKGEKFSFGFNWRGGFEIEYDGNLDLDTSSVGGPVPARMNGTVVAPFSFPHIIGVGAAFNLTDKLTVTADVHYVLWSAFEEIVVEAEVPGLPVTLDFPPIDESFEDSFIFRGGLQYMLDERFALRAGFLYDQTPQPVTSMDPMLPDADRWAVTAGFGYNTGKFAIDLAYQYEPFKDRTSPNRDIYDTPLGNFGEGTYSSTAHLFGVSFRFMF